MVWSLHNAMIADDVANLFDAVGRQNADRPDFTPAMTREQAEAAVHAILWAAGCRKTDTAAAYAYANLWQALGIDGSVSV